MRRSKSWLCYLAAVCPRGSQSPSLSLGWDSNPSLLRYVLRIKPGSVCKAPRTGLGVDGRNSQQLRALGALGPSTPSLGPFHGLSSLGVPSALTPSLTLCLEPPWEGIRWPTGWWSTLPAPCLSPAPEPPCNLPSTVWSPTPPPTSRAPLQVTNYARCVIFAHHRIPKGRQNPPVLWRQKQRFREALELPCPKEEGVTD